MSAADPLRLAEAYQQTAIVAAACQTGVADALWASPGLDAATVAERCSTHPRATRSLLAALRGLGLCEVRDGGWTLSEAGAPLAREHPSSVAGIVAKEHVFYGVWGDLAGAVRDGHARMAPWRERLDSDPETALSFLRALDDLAARFGGELPALADAPAAGRVLDVGGGAGSHAAALRAHAPGLEAVVLDLPAVEAVVRERHPELAFVAGDLDAPRFGRPEGETWDAVLLANVLHDLDAAAAARCVRGAAELLAPGGVLLAYEWVLDDDALGPPAVVPFALMMLVENEGGNAWTEGELRGWCGAAGLVDVELRRGLGPIAVLRARRP